ncbi:GIY-YIG nuclease family protein [Chondromyces apiculatus]|uniref:Excinuclease ABC subunit C n=1 Tax=Chondromyces apiculatus DSM 436 TaxID=1192034 RepID=A0A017T5B0_9BACT|nr:GIY-YIG nuclease family protein [Chondromyces apiculatus]EYF04177.1 Excinuclease ABC subunit C [Chondromyces apiculatus DSM 436]
MPRASLLRPRPKPAEIKERITRLHGLVREGTENRPGVYQMANEDGHVVYVGKSKRLRTRLLGYFRAAAKEKGARILKESTAVSWEYCPSEFAALLAELRLIKRFRPKFNVVMKRDLRRYAFLQLTHGPAPKLRVVGGSARDPQSLYYGPFTSRSRTHDAARALSNALGLRDCAEDVPIVFSDQQELFPLGRRTPGCLRFEIKRCLGPCVGGCSASAYTERVGLARAFLEGHSEGPIAQFRAEMLENSARAEYERAAALRDRVKQLEILREQLKRLRFALESLSFLYTVPGHGGDDRIYLVRRGSVRAEMTVPRSEAEHEALHRLAGEVYGPHEPAAAPVPLHEVEEVLLLSSWFQRFPDELARTQPFVLQQHGSPDTRAHGTDKPGRTTASRNRTSAT